MIHVLLRAAAPLLLLVACASTDRSAKDAASRPALDAADDAFLEDLSRRTFRWFWDTAEPATGLVPDRHPTRNFASVAAQGFALTAYGIGAERGWVERSAAAKRSADLLTFLLELPQGDTPDGVAGHRGFFYHFLELDTGLRARRCEVSSIDTGLLLAGALFARGYFDGDSPDERRVREAATALHARVDWPWFVTVRPRRQGSFDDERLVIRNGWRPETGPIPYAYEGYDEAMVMYLIALGAPRPAPPEVWEGFTATYLTSTFGEQIYLQFPPLFGHQYSHCWIDFRGIADAHVEETGIDYFENSRRATLAQVAYASENPEGFTGYGPELWGWTACDGPASVEAGGRVFHRYWARGVGARYVNDDGTIAPTAVGGSLPFAPEVCLPTLRAMVESYGDLVFREHGFVDAFNPTFVFPEHADVLEFGSVDPVHGWFDDEQLGIDQGPILLMAENLRSGLVWDVVRRDADLVRGLRAAGFRGGWLGTSGRGGGAR